MVDAPMKTRHLTSTDKTLQDQLLEEEKANLQWLDVSKALATNFSLFFDFAAETKYST